MRILEHPALTFDDVLLVPQYSDVLPKSVSLKTQIGTAFELQIPLLSAAMDTVTEDQFAISLAQEGGLGIIHKNMSPQEQARQVKLVKKFESGIVKDPIVVTPDTTVSELTELTRAHQISGVPVVSGNQVVGIVTGRDVRFEQRLNIPVSQIMTPQEQLVTVKEGATREEIVQLLHKHRIEKLLVVDDHFALKGLITVKDIQKAQDKPWATKDEQGRLRVGAAVGTGPETDERAECLIHAGVDVLVVDTAHGDSKGVIQRVAWLKKHFPLTPVIAGNIATYEAARRLLDAGVDAVKVGIGPGSICTTRIIAGVGVPQITAICEVSRALEHSTVSIIADGGIRHSGDVVKALATGAHAVMIGGLFAGTEEAPGDVELYQGRAYKSYRGMGSLGAMAQGSSDRYFQELEGNGEKLVPEGIEGRVPYKGPVASIIHQLMGGLRSGMGYVGAPNLAALRERACLTQITAAGMRESHVHDVIITKEPPNYQGTGQ